MKKILLPLLIITSLSSCTVTLPVTASSNPVGSKVGRSKTTAVLGFHPDGGNIGIQLAAKNGGISRISTVDVKKSMVFLWIVQTYETIVTGD